MTQQASLAKKFSQTQAISVAGFGGPELGIHGPNAAVTQVSWMIDVS